MISGLRFLGLLAWACGASSAIAAAVMAQPPAPAEAPEVEPQGEARLDLIEAALAPSPQGLTAEEVVARALETSPRVASAGLAGDKAAANEARAKLAFAPRLDLLGRYTRTSYVTMPSLGPGQGRLPQVNNQWYTQASVTLPITDLFLTIIPTYRAAERLSDVADLQRQAAELQISYDARVAFYQYVRAQGFLAATNDRVRVLAANARDLEALVQAGAAAESDLLRARATLADAEASRTARTGDIEVAMLQLSQLLGAPLEPTRGIGEVLVSREIEPTPDLPSILRVANGQRPELLALRRLEQANAELATSRRGARWPALKAVGNGYYADPNPRIFPQKNEFRGTWDVGLVLSWSPNDFTMANSQVSDADTERALTLQDLKATENGVAIEAAAAVTAHRAARDEVSAKIQLVEAARRYYNDQRIKMLAGAATPNDVLIAENQLHDAELAWIDAFVHTRLAQAALLKVQGQTRLAPRSPN